MLPPKVHLKHGRYFYVHQGKWHGLSRESDGEDSLYKSLARHLDESPPATIKEIAEKYQLSHLPKKAYSTRKDYERRLRAVIVPVFGDMAAREIIPSDVAQFLEARGGPTANREMAILSDIFQFAMRQGYVDSNPCRGVRRNPEKPRDRYIEDWELNLVYNLADERLQDVIGVAYLTGMRQGDLRGLKRDNIQDDGIHWIEGKRKKRRHVLWSDALWAHVERALERSKIDFVLTARPKLEWTLWGLQSAWRRLMAASELEEKFTFHDIRAKAGSDAKDGRGLLAHSSEALFRRVYERKARPVNPTR